MNAKILFDQVLADCFIIGRFGELQSVSRAAWDRVPGDIRARLEGLEYVDVRPDIVLLTVEGEDVMAYRETILT
jgi:hypothetical protein